MAVSKISEAIEDIRNGKMIILVDDEDRENEGDLCMAAQFVTPQAINFMARYGRGLICLTINEEIAARLKLNLMVKDNQARFGTAFTVSIEARHGVTTGISAADRATTILAAVHPAAKPEDIVSPGHVFPILARKGGVLVRTGQTEGSVDLCRLAGLTPAGVICEIKNPDGSMARLPQLREFADRFGLRITTVASLISHRRHTERLVKHEATVHLPTPWGQFIAHGYECTLDQKPYVALVMGDVTQGDVLVRVHSSCLTGDVFHSRRCDCGEQLHSALEIIAREGRGVLLYIQQEGRDIGLINKLKAYELQEHGKDTVEANEALGFAADLRDYGVGAQVLADLGLSRIRLITNNPKKVVGLEGYGLQVVERVPLCVTPTADNRHYLETKMEKLGHLIEL